MLPGQGEQRCVVSAEDGGGWLESSNWKCICSWKDSLITEFIRKSNLTDCSLFRRWGMLYARNNFLCLLHNPLCTSPGEAQWKFLHGKSCFHALNGLMACSPKSVDSLIRVTEGDNSSASWILTCLDSGNVGFRKILTFIHQDVQVFREWEFFHQREIHHVIKVNTVWLLQHLGVPVF